MKVIMLKTIEKVGKQGEVVNVKRGFARNYLVPKKLAIYATPANLKNLANIQSKLADEEQKLMAELKNLAEKIDTTNLVFKRKVDEQGSMFGSVSELDIINGLQELGIQINKSALSMEKHYKELGEFNLPVRLHKDIICSLNIKIEPEQ
ncbi:MAG TPA: 50S ribosomal protein L9 [Candidatus Cloacimonas sp.]|jgi:large subunit ribosomal protein L9|nr:50S ribosomal protein L9 [Candidatus Cloacimonas sp.]MDD2250189.1 50S ribosomal protein L9 [Candidatus Cloacimonadota bacterium]MCK9158195.1 50S ribosomal protein L9 [Candidatus Cloacimonas sp.]MCK9165149.1 50S ribosomal protein L9 [Candidatus Cloacimonas sp.]MDD3734086.1 50S ribosomal protein L9 [Candidatus Cloacimonadota bacterium]